MFFICAKVYFIFDIYNLNAEFTDTLFRKKTAHVVLPCFFLLNRKFYVSLRLLMVKFLKK